MAIVRLRSCADCIERQFEVFPGVEIYWINCAMPGTSPLVMEHTKKNLSPRHINELLAHMSKILKRVDLNIEENSIGAKDLPTRTLIATLNNSK